MTVTAPAAEMTPSDGVSPVGSGRPGRVASLAVLVFGIIGLVSASVLSIEKYEILVNPSYRPSCSINPIISCGSVMTAHQASFFGFPNPLIGIAAFSVVVVTGVLSVAGIALPRWYWIGLVAGLVAGMVFIHYLIIESLYRINALCPYCMVVWTITAALLVTVCGIVARTLHGRGWSSAAGWLWTLLVLWYVVVILLIAEHFWYYWQTLI